MHACVCVCVCEGGGGGEPRSPLTRKGGERKNPEGKTGLLKRPIWKKEDKEEEGAL